MWYNDNNFLSHVSIPGWMYTAIMCHERRHIVRVKSLRSIDSPYYNTGSGTRRLNSPSLNMFWLGCANRAIIPDVTP